MRDTISVTILVDKKPESIQRIEAENLDELLGEIEQYCKVMTLMSKRSYEYQATI